MADFTATAQSKFFAATGITAPGTPSNSDDSAERATLAAAISGGDPATIAQAAIAVALRDAEEIAQQVIVNRANTACLRRLLVGLTGMGIDGLQLAPAIQQAIIPAREGEIVAGSAGYVGEAATGVWNDYLAELRSDSSAVLT